MHCIKIVLIIHVICRQDRVAFAMKYDDVGVGLLVIVIVEHQLICAPRRLSHCSL